MKRTPLFLVAALGLSACASSHGDNLRAAAQIVPPASWRATHDGAAQPISATWWSAFGDAQLAAYVEAARAHNTDLAVAEARVREAQASAQVARSGLLPSLRAAIGAQDARDLNAFGVATDTLAAQTQVQVAYEVDLWGRVRALDRAGRNALAASQAGRESVALSVSAATARSYIVLLSLDEQLRISRDTLASREGARHVARRRADAGYSSQLEATQAEVEYEAAVQRVAALELAMRRQENAFRALIGEPPGEVPRGRFANLVLPSAIQSGAPSHLLARRPDIAQAEANLAAADSNLAAARAAFLPQVQLSAAAGLLFVDGLAISPVDIWSAGGSVLAPIFDAGRLRAQVDGANARRDQAAFAYRSIVLNAFAETENALQGAVRLGEQRQALERQRAAAARALTIATNRYAAGYASYLEQLDAQRGLFSVELGLVQTREAELSNAVALYLALGGGYVSAGAGE